MKPKTVLALSIKVLALTAIQFIVFALASAMLLPQADAEPAAAQQATGAAVSLLVVCALNAVVFAYIILRSRWAGLRLAVAVFILYYGAMTVMNQIESAIFLTNLPPGMVPRLFVVGAVEAVVFSPPAVVILGKTRAHTPHLPTERLLMPAGEWAWKLAAIAVMYLVLYFTFGYYVAWQSSAVRAYYGGTDPGSFFGQMQSVLGETPWLPAIQVLRGMMWTALALPVIRMMKGRWWEAGLAVALLFSVVADAQLLLPNPYMPEAVRMAHLVETASSNFIFGWLIVWLLHRHHASLRDLFQKEGSATAAGTRLRAA
ncbi:MAG TPA: hypothetical protein VFG50_06060 [Rhodothermales bacterium]|nr:hypothetical protein [Rhodothermales bacterium]